MTKQDKELLIKDLCARLPYDTIISVNDGKYREDVKLHCHYIFDWDAERWDAKPYLRPMSSMTEEEIKEFIDVVTWQEADGTFHIDECQDISFYQEKYDWLNAHHFDYRGLIEKGLAIEAPDGMYDF